MDFKSILETMHDLDRSPKIVNESMTKKIVETSSCSNCSGDGLILCKKCQGNGCAKCDYDGLTKCPNCNKSMISAPKFVNEDVDTSGIDMQALSKDQNEISKEPTEEDHSDDCSYCGGTGQQFASCPAGCNGANPSCHECDGIGFDKHEMVVCDDCAGTGKKPKKRLGENSIQRENKTMKNKSYKGKLMESTNNGFAKKNIKALADIVLHQKKLSIVVLGAGGDPQEWVNGISTELIKAGIAKNMPVFEDSFLIDENKAGADGRTDLALIFSSEADINTGRLAMWRLHNGAGSISWGDDFIHNYGHDYNEMSLDDEGDFDPNSSQDPAGETFDDFDTDLDLEESVEDGWSEKQVFEVHIPANIYDGKYYDFRSVRVMLAKGANGVETEQDACDWINSHKEQVLADIAKKRMRTGSRTVPYVKKPAEKNVFFNGSSVNKRSDYYVKLIKITTKKAQINEAVEINIVADQENGDKLLDLIKLSGITKETNTDVVDGKTVEILTDEETPMVEPQMSQGSMFAESKDLKGLQTKLIAAKENLAKLKKDKASKDAVVAATKKVETIKDQIHDETKNESKNVNDILKLSGVKLREATAEDVKKLESENQGSWANEPNEQVLDTDTQLITLSGGLNGPKKMINKRNMGDNAMTIEADKEKAKVKESLMARFAAFKVNEDKGMNPCKHCGYGIFYHGTSGDGKRSICYDLNNKQIKCPGYEPLKKNKKKVDEGNSNVLDTFSSKAAADKFAKEEREKGNKVTVTKKGMYAANAKWEVKEVSKSKTKVDEGIFDMFKKSKPSNDPKTYGGSNYSPKIYQAVIKHLEKTNPTLTNKSMQSIAMMTSEDYKNDLQGAITKADEMASSYAKFSARGLNPDGPAFGATFYDPQRDTTIGYGLHTGFHGAVDAISAMTAAKKIAKEKGYKLIRLDDQSNLKDIFRDKDFSAYMSKSKKDI